MGEVCGMRYHCKSLSLPLSFNEPFAFLPIAESLVLPITKLISSLFFVFSSCSENLSKKYYYGWRTWHIEMPVDAEGWLEFCCRTWDNANNTQPTYVRSAWYVSFFSLFLPSIHPQLLLLPLLS